MHTRHYGIDESYAHGFDYAKDLSRRAQTRAPTGWRSRRIFQWVLWETQSQHWWQKVSPLHGCVDVIFKIWLWKISCSKFKRVLSTIKADRFCTLKTVRAGKHPRDDVVNGLFESKLLCNCILLFQLEVKSRAQNVITDWLSLTVFDLNVLTDMMRTPLNHYDRKHGVNNCLPEVLKYRKKLKNTIFSCILIPLFGYVLKGFELFLWI